MISSVVQTPLGFCDSNAVRRDFSCLNSISEVFSLTYRSGTSESDVSVASDEGRWNGMGSSMRTQSCYFLSTDECGCFPGRNFLTTLLWFYFGFFSQGIFFLFFMPSILLFCELKTLHVQQILISSTIPCIIICSSSSSSEFHS